jgi:hypothetical protein
MGIMKRTLMGLLLFALCVSGAVAAEGQRQALGTLQISGNVVTLQPATDYDRVRVTVAGKGGNVYEKWFAAGEPVSYNAVDNAGRTLFDGAYHYEVMFVTAKQSPRSLTGSFRMAGGQLVAKPAETRPRREQAPVNMSSPIRNVTGNDVYLADDLNIEGSTCTSAIGSCADSPATENFNTNSAGTAELKMKSTITDLWFQDTDSGEDDFVITVDSDVFKINNDTTNLDVFAITAGGNIGMGTTTPAQEIHAVSTKGSFIRLEDTDDSTWDFGTNDDGDFAFNIIVNAAGQGTGQIVTIDDGLESLGIWSSNPAATLDVQTPPGTGETAKIRVNDTNGSAAERVLYELNNNGKVRFLLHNRNTGLGWTFDNSAVGFEISDVGDGIGEFVLQPNGNLQITGTLTQLSDINTKQDILPVNTSEILDKVAAIPVSEWRYKEDPAVRHVGPMAQDFHAAFGLGGTDKGIAAIDSEGIALASIQALYERSKTLEGENVELRNRLAALEAKLQALVDQK